MAAPSSDTFIKIDNAAHSGAFGNNPLPLPTDKQVEAGNYKKGKFNLHGLRIAIEQPQYSLRTGVDKNGKSWACRLAANYGYILNTTGNDGDHLDCFIGSYPQSDRIYVINQYVNGKFDEHKVMLCYLGESFAKSDYQLSYSRDWNGLHSMVELTIKQFKQWLKHGDMTKPIAADNLPITEIEQMKQIHWTPEGMPIGTTTARIVYEMQAIDKDDGLLLDSINADDIYHDYGDCMLPESAFLDSLNMPYAQLERRMGVVRGAFNRAGTELKVAEPAEGEASPQIIGPYKKDGVTMLTALFNLTDGQTISIVFHNPDSTPAKITPADTVIAWKWMLNKKDITIIVAPEKGEDLKPMDVAKRIMILAEKNSAAFQRANGKVSEQNQAITDLKTEIGTLESELAQAQADYEIAKQAADDKEVEQVINPATAGGGFIATHTYNDPDNGTVEIMRNEDGNWQSADGTEYLDIDNEVVAIKDDPNFPDYGVDYGNGFPEEVVNPEVSPELSEQKNIVQNMIDAVVSSGNEQLKTISDESISFRYRMIDAVFTCNYSPKSKDYSIRFVDNEGNSYYSASFETPDKAIVDMLININNGEIPEINQIKGEINPAQPAQGIDPVAKSNIEAANISAAIKKKAIAYLSANPTSHEIKDIAHKSLKAIMESVKEAFFAEILSINPLFERQETLAGQGVAIVLDNNSWVQIEVQDRYGYKVTFETMDETTGINRNHFDSTKTLEDLKSWGFALPFDLDVKAFVANVIKPVVDEFLSKQSAVYPEMDKTTPTMSDEEVKKAIIDGHRDTDLMLLVGDYFGIDSELDETDVYAGLTKNKNITPEKLRQAYELVAFTEGSESIPIPFEFYSMFEAVNDDDDEKETLDIDQVSEKTRTAWIIEKIIKQHDGVVSWGDFNGAVSESIFDSVLNGVVGQFGTKDGGVVGYVEINDNGEAAISINSKGSAVRPPENIMTDEIGKIKSQIDDAYASFVESEVVEGDFPDWKTKPAVTVVPAAAVEPAKPLTEIQQQELKLSRLQGMQDRMKAVNKIIKSKTLSDDQKRAKLTDAGFGAEASKLDISERWKDGMANGYAAYELTNNNATIKNTKNRIDELKKRELSASMAASGDRETSYDFDGGTVDLDYGDDRLRVNFDTKPDREMIAKLKSSGFKWSPTNSAWQRQLTDNAIYSTNLLLGTEIKTASQLAYDLENKRANMPEPTPTPTPEPQPELPVVETPVNSFDADIEALRGETDYTVFNDKLDELAGKLEAAGLMEQYDTQLNELADLLTELLKKAA